MAVALGLHAGLAEARPTYFDAFKIRYSIAPGSNLDACGVCHFKWTGTGQRNPFGSAVEQQLYVGKSIDQSLADIEGDDTDGDTFINVDEIVTFETLPGYSCANYFEAIDPPNDYHTYIQPDEATCLTPIDIRVDPTTVGTFLAIGETEIMPVEIFNNGSDFSIDVSSLAFAAGFHPSYSLAGPVAPFSIPVGESVGVDIVYSPTAVGSHTATLEIESNDPDESTVFVTASSFGFEKVLAPAEDRAACLGTVAKEYGKYVRSHLGEWNDCYLDEVGGVACNAGARDAKLLKAAARFRSRVGGAKDRDCAANGLTPSLLDIPATCGGGGSCDELEVTSIAEFAECLLCRQDQARDQELLDAVGVAPPDLPVSTAGTAAALRCQKKLLSGMRKAIGSIQKTLGRCEIANILAASPVDCVAENAARIGKAQAKVDGAAAKCSDTSGLASCPFVAMPDPQCLGTSAAAVGSSLTDTTFGFAD